MPVNTCSEYLSLLAKSKAVDSETIEEVTDKYSELTDPRQLSQSLVRDGILTDWQARFVLSGRHRLMIGQYLLLNRFAKQAVGDRFLANHRQLDRKVDVLVFPKDADRNKKLFKAFMEQAARVAELNHRNLLHVYDIDREGERYFLVFEHDNGDSLRNIPTGNLQSRQIAVICHESLKGISYAHEKGVIHGKLDESQIRIDQDNRVCIRNIGLANLLDQLQEEKPESDDDFEITAEPVDDIVNLGRICQTLFRQHVGQPKTESDKSLYRLLGEVASATNVNDGQTQTLFDATSQWLEKYDAANREKTARPVTSTTSNTQESTKSSNARKTSSATKSRNKSNAKSATKSAGKANASGSVSTRKRTLVFAACGAVIGGLVFGVIAALKEDPTVAENDAGSANDAAQIDQADDQDFNRPAVSLDEAAASLRTKDSKSEAARIDSIIGQENISPPRPSQDSPISSIAVPAVVPPTTEVQESPQEETNQQVAATPKPLTKVNFPGAEGLEVVNWMEAHTKDGQEIVAFGLIKDVGSSRSGSLRYLNFKPNDYSAFKIVISTREIDITEDKLRERYYSKNLLVRGLVKPFRGNPQIQINSLDQIKVVEALPSLENGSMTVSDESSEANAVASTGAFAGTPNGFPLPELTRDAPSFERVLLGPLTVGEDPVGMRLQFSSEILKNPPVFSMERDPSNTRRWEISFAVNQREAESLKPVAEINLDNDQLYFNWIPTEKLDLKVNYVANAILTILTPTESKTVLLRQPVLAQPIVLEEKKPLLKQRLELKYLPRPETISIEFFELPKEKFAEQFSDYGTTLNTAQDSTTILFDKVPENQFFQLWHKADISTVIKMESALQIALPFTKDRDRPEVMSRNNLKSLRERLFRHQAEISQLNADAIAFEAPHGQKTKHKERKKKISAQLELVNAQVAAYTAAEPMAKSVIGTPIGYRVFFTVENVEYLLMTTQHSSDE